MAGIPFLELSPKFIKSNSEGGWRAVDSADDADGVMFLCPLCYQRNGGSVGTHQVVIWDLTVPISPLFSGPGRWALEGETLGSLSLSPAAPGRAHSVHLQGGCGWHGYVTNGQATII